MECLFLFRYIITNTWHCVHADFPAILSHAGETRNIIKLTRNWVGELR